MAVNNLEFSLDDVRAALSCLDESDMDLWVRMGMAIKGEFGEAGFDIWDSWSHGYTKYKQKEALARWKSFKIAGARGTVTMGSLFHLAMERGFTFARPEFTPEQKTAFALEREVRQREREVDIEREEAETLRWQAVVAAACNDLVPHLKFAGNSKYLGKKKVRAFGIYFAPHSFVIRTNENFSVDIFNGGDAVKEFFNKKTDSDSFVFFKRGTILVPLQNTDAQLCNLQIIFTDGQSKRFFKEGRKSGCFHIIGEITPDKPIVFCEGYATGASIHMATGWPVVVCFDAGNLPGVAAIFSSHSNIKICAGDNDWETALEPTKKNTGLLKAQEGAIACGGIWCVPKFTGDAKGLSDFNDLHVSEGLPVVKVQLEIAIQNPPPNFIFATGDKNFLSLDASERRYSAIFPPGSPPDFSDIPLPDENYLQGEFLTDQSAASPESSLNVDQITLDGLLLRYAMTDPDAKIWDSFSKKIIKAGAFKNIVRPKIYNEWLTHESRRTVLLEDVQRQAAAQQKKGRGGLSDALNRYVYLNPSDTVWDREVRELVAVGHLKIAIADCFAMWVAHPDREEIPMRNLVFDPSQKTDTKTHINQFRGLVCKPIHDDKRCERIVAMLMGLCNNDVQVFRWLRRWLAYPLIKVGAKMETAVLVHSSVHGSGKSYFFDVVMRQIYGEYSRTVGQAQLEGNYNDWMSKTLYCVFEEVLSRSQRYSHVGTIKQTITGKTIRIEKKFMSGWEEANHMNTVFLSNEVLPLPVEPSDRRFLVIWPESTMYEHLQRGVDEDLANGGAAAFYHLLLNTNMHAEGEQFPFDEHTKPPMTEAKQRLIEHGRPIWEVFYNAWEAGELIHNNKTIPYDCMRVGDLFAIFETWCSTNKEHGMGAHKFSSFINSKLKKRRDLRYEFLSLKGKATFYMIGKCPHDKTQEQWLGECVLQMETILSIETIASRQAA
ncbi:MAG: PriCT-2 domain-containing protein [Pseudomonadota bacterium]